MPIGGAQQKPPPAIKQNPYTPGTPEPLLFEDFAGINTSTTRPGVPDEQAYWLDGFMPIAKRNARTLPGVGTTLYTAAGTTVVWYGFGNIGATPYCIIFLANGSVVAVNTTTLATTTVLASGTIASPTIVGTGLSQWGREYIIIVADQTDGYWLWDGDTVFTAGTLGPIVTLTNVGSGYKTVPFVAVSGGSGSGATFTAAIANGVVTGVTVGSPGSGYRAGDTLVLAFSGGNSGGSGGTLTAIMGGGTPGSGGSIVLGTTLVGAKRTVTSATVAAAGSGYTQFTTATASASTFLGGPRPAALSLSFSGGTISGVTITDPGAYSFGDAPTATITDPGSFFVSSVTVNSAGSGYSPSAFITPSGGSVVSPVVATLNLTGGSIASVTVQSGGIYTSATPPTLTVTDTVVNAAATAELMPFAIQGTWAETYQGRVWVGKQAVTYFSAPGSFSNFSTASGGGNFTSADSFLQNAIVRGKSTNGFLYLFGDSSINYISGVQTSGTPPTTTFTNQNADPEVGTPYPQSVITVGQNLLFANSFGIHLLAGAKVTKISEALDGVWNTVANFGALQLSAAKANVFSRKCWMVLARIVDPVTLATVNKLMMWDGGKKWWTSPQDITMTFIASQEINSVFTAYATNGTIVTPMFQTATSGFTKTAQSRLWDAPGGYLLEKAASRFWGMFQYNSTVSPNFTLSVDNEDGIMAQGSGATVVATLSGGTVSALSVSAAGSGYSSNPSVVFTGGSPSTAATADAFVSGGSIVGVTAVLFGAGYSATPTVTIQDIAVPYTITGPTRTGFFVVPAMAVGQVGELTGMTLRTTAADMSLISAMLGEQVVGYRG